MVIIFIEKVIILIAFFCNVIISFRVDTYVFAQIITP